jgi:hypothetical protein
MEDTKGTTVVILAVVALTVFAMVVKDCSICDIMANPPEWIDSWYEPPEMGPQG